MANDSNNYELESDNSNNDHNDYDMDNAISDNLDNTVLRLSDYLSAIDMVINETFSHSVWVKAEIRNLSSKGGHYYLELAEKDDDGKIVASCRATLWRFKATQVLGKFERVTGMPLERDLTVLVKVNANFHVQYGFSLNISDIDPSYTLGDLAKQYAAMLERLSNEGLLELNKRLPDPFDIEHVLVIAPEKAAGLGDFRADADKLERTGACHFHYHHATFQGNHAPKEIRHAIIKGMLSFKQSFGKDSSIKGERLPDVMVIIRGGGAVGDLAYLNDYELAALVAEQPVPVWVGIGHERDHVILDDVAHTSFDTPSKVISNIVNHLSTLMQQTQDYVDITRQLSLRQLADAALACEREYNRIENSSHHHLQRYAHLSDTYYTTVKQHARFCLREVSLKSQNYVDTIQAQSQTHIKRAQTSVDYWYQTTQTASQRLLDDTAKQLRHYQQLIFIQHPTRQLSQGYALIKDKKQRYISSVANVHKGDFVTISLQDGDLTTVVIDIENTATDITELTQKYNLPL